MSTTPHLAESALRSFQAGDMPGAERAARKALQADPENGLSLHLLGVICHHSGRNAEALPCLQRALRVEPLNAGLLNNLGNVCAALGRVDEALAHYREALHLRPDFAEAHNNLATELAARERFVEAEEHYREALRSYPNSAAVHNNLGVALLEQGRPADAERYYREALRLLPDYPEAHGNLAGVLVELGRPEEAVPYCRESLRLNPRSTGAYACLGTLASQGLYHFSDEQVRGMEGLLTAGGLSCEDASRLHFTLAALLDRQGDYDRAFSHYQQANDLRAQDLRQKGRAFDPERHRRFIDEIIATCDRGFVERVGSFGLDTEMPVFVVGMPRSGTTLVAQILSSHPQMVAAGELRDLDEILNPPSQQTGACVYPQSMSRLDPATARALAAHYVDRLASLGGEPARVIDKMPHNYLYLGAIVALFPGARIIHCRRDARDTCLSCYFQNFTWVNYACSLEHLGFYYRQYERLMRHWKEALPPRMYEVRYEELVGDQERISRELVAFCGLDWSDRCLDFHKNARAVQTASKLQVRRPIYTTSVARWKRYEKHLLPLEHALSAQ